MRRMIFAEVGLGGLFAASSTSEAHAGYTLTDINVLRSQPDSTDGVGLNDRDRSSEPITTAPPDHRHC